MSHSKWHFETVLPPHFVSLSTPKCCFVVSNKKLCISMSLWQVSKPRPKHKKWECLTSKAQFVRTVAEPWYIYCAVYTSAVSCFFHCLKSSNTMAALSRVSQPIQVEYTDLTQSSQLWYRKGIGGDHSKKLSSFRVSLSGINVHIIVFSCLRHQDFWKIH